MCHHLLGDLFLKSRMREIHEIDKLEDYLLRGDDLCNCVIQELDLREVDVDWEKVEVCGAVFLGCTFPSLEFQDRLRESCALVFPKIPNLPYRPYRPSLYTREELMEGWTPAEDASVDKQIYDHFEGNGRHKSPILESLCQRLHDHAIDDALHDLLNGDQDGGVLKKVVAIMGGHSTLRTDSFFRKTAMIARSLTRHGYFVASGGGPGIMEAANLGAWIANAEDDFLSVALEILAKAPKYTDSGFNECAQEVLALHPEGEASVAIPTWFYGHEPSNLFSLYIAKYFSNSLREDGLLAIAKYGVIYAPGSAGTTQEIFMDASQNHYGSFEYVSPMVFLGKERYETETGLFPTMKRLSAGRQYAEGLGLTDDPDEAVELILKNPPIEYLAGGA